MTVLTEVKRVRIGNSCVENPVYLIWRNMLSGYNYFLFSKRQVISVETKLVMSMKKAIDTWATQTSIQEVVQKSAFKKMKLGVEDLDLQTVEGMMSLLYSQKVEMLIDGSNNIWNIVILSEGAFEIADTGESRFMLEFEIIYPEIQTVTM